MRPLPLQAKSRAYPRSCGETHIFMQAGNRVHGPIPARAGKPSRPAMFSFVVWAYPRSCGETCQRFIRVAYTQGLSPLVRGNRVDENQRQPARGPIPARAGKPILLPPSRLVTGPIPARAGKPVASDLNRSATRAYPRSCGETSRA